MTTVREKILALTDPVRASRRPVIPQIPVLDWNPQSAQVKMKAPVEYFLNEMSVFVYIAPNHE